MEKHFWRPVDHMFACENYLPTGTSIDLIYIGKKARFPNSQGGFAPVKMHYIAMAKPTSVIGTDFTGQLTDHNAHGFEFYFYPDNVEPCPSPCLGNVESCERLERVCE